MPETTTDPPIESDTDLEQELAEARDALSQAQTELARAKREAAISSAIEASAPHDPELVRALLNERLTDDADPAESIADIKRTRPALFHAPPSQLTSAMAPVDDTHDSPVASAHKRASATGDRKALLHYLRIRRTA